MRNKIKDFLSPADRKLWTFTKRWVNTFFIFTIIWITWSFVLATIGRNVEYIVELSKTVAEIAIPVIVGYLGKSFFETFCEKNIEYKYKKLEKEKEVD